MSVSDPGETLSGYMGWKGWGARGFGVLERGDSDYFTRETRDAIDRGSAPKVLEVGFGNGTFLAHCRLMGWNVTGSELLPELVELATSAGYHAIAADRLHTLADASFDLIVAFDVFEHIPPEHSTAFLSQLASKLRKDGRILLRYPNADSWIGNPFQNGDVTHVNAIGALKTAVLRRRSGTPDRADAGDETTWVPYVDRARGA